jgi:DNA-directed RNA polymerase specialized sigma24 family protein
VQECFLELLRPECGYDSKRTPLQTYLFGVVRNQSLKRLRAPHAEAIEANGQAAPRSDAYAVRLARHRPGDRGQPRARGPRTQAHRQEGQNFGAGRESLRGIC